MKMNLLCPFCGAHLYETPPVRTTVSCPTCGLKLDINEGKVSFPEQVTIPAKEVLEADGFHSIFAKRSAFDYKFNSEDVWKAKKNSYYETLDFIQSPSSKLLKMRDIICEGFVDMLYADQILARSGKWEDYNLKKLESIEDLKYLSFEDYLYRYIMSKAVIDSDIQCNRREIITCLNILLAPTLEQAAFLLLRFTTVTSLPEDMKALTAYTYNNPTKIFKYGTLSLRNMNIELTEHLKGLAVNPSEIKPPEYTRYVELAYEAVLAAKTQNGPSRFNPYTLHCVAPINLFVNDNWLQEKDEVTYDRILLKRVFMNTEFVNVAKKRNSYMEVTKTAPSAIEAQKFWYKVRDDLTKKIS